MGDMRDGVREKNAIQAEGDLRLNLGGFFEEVQGTILKINFRRINSQFIGMKPQTLR